jgi:hypothetical protein
MNFGSREKTVARIVRPVQRDGSCEGNEKVLEGYGWVASDEFIAEARPGIDQSCYFEWIRVHTKGDGQSIEREQ